MRSDFFAGEHPRVFAHRGLALEAPENTLLAFAHALAADVPYIETDVHATADGVAVISHDPDLARVAGRELAVRSLTMAELRRIDLGDGQAFCSLADALDAFPEARFNIDVKADDAAEATARAVDSARARGRVLIASSSEARRRATIGLLPGVATSASAAIVLRARLAAASGSLERLTRALAGVDALQIPERVRGFPLLTSRFVRRVQQAGAEVHVWTINAAPDMRRLLDAGVDGLVTDRSDVALEVVAAHS